MPSFVPGQPVVTSDPRVEVTVSANAPLAPGHHRFQLIVVDDSGNESDPAVVDVVVIDNKKPTAVIDAPATVPFGTSFSLSGTRSTDPPPGKIVQYRWLQLT